MRQATAETRQQTVASLRTAVAMTSEAEQTGAATMEELSKQRETLERTQRKVDALEAHAEHSSFILRGMKSIVGSVRNKFSKKPKDAQEAVADKAAARAGKSGGGSSSSGGSGGSGGARSSAGGAGGAGGAGVSGSGSASVSAGGGAKLQTTGRTEEDELLEAISANVSRLGVIGQEMGAELGTQDKMLDELHASVTRADSKVKENAKLARKLAR